MRLGRQLVPCVSPVALFGSRLLLLLLRFALLAIAGQQKRV